MGIGVVIGIFLSYKSYLAFSYINPKIRFIHYSKIIHVAIIESYIALAMDAASLVLDIIVVTL